VGKKRGAYRVMVGKLEGKRLIARPRCKWKDSIKNGSVRNLGDMDWIGLAEDRDKWQALMDMVMY
jgi:hypothetical protein